MIFKTEKGKTMKLKIILEPSEEGGYTAFLPSLPGCISEGDTKEEALKKHQGGHRAISGAC